MLYVFESCLVCRLNSGSASSGLRMLYFHLISNYICFMSMKFGLSLEGQAENIFTEDRRPTVRTKKSTAANSLVTYGHRHKLLRRNNEGGRDGLGI
jgi:hypothetical protein